jgi:hypothetical protein
LAGLWLRLYTEVTRDRKLRRLPSDQRWLWIAILSVAKESPKPGWLLLADGVPVTTEDLADEAAVPIDQVNAGLKAFTDQMMLKEVNGIWHCLNWNKRNFISDTSTERVKKFRGKKDETFQKRSGNKKVTPPETEYRDQNTETDNNNPLIPLKQKYAEFVSLTNAEYKALVAKLENEQRVKRCIEILDNYKGANGKRYKSDYRAILNWVIDRLIEEEQRSCPPPPREPTDDELSMQKLYEEMRQDGAFNEHDPTPGH